LEGAFGEEFAQLKKGVAKLFPQFSSSAGLQKRGVLDRFRRSDMSGVSQGKRID